MKVDGEEGHEDVLVLKGCLDTKHYTTYQVITFVIISSSIVIEMKVRLQPV